MNRTNPLERMNARIECIGEGRLDGCGEMDHMPEAFVGHGHDRGIITCQLVQDPIEALEVDRLASDLDEVSGAAVDSQSASVDIAEVLGDEPAVDLWIDQAFFRGVAGEE